MSAKPRSSQPRLSFFEEFVRRESSGGIVLVVVALVAFLWANSPWAPSYFNLLQIKLSLGLGSWIELDKPLMLWVNDGLMAIFFLFVGLEIKRELLAGELADRRAAALPIAAALGGMVVPAGIYWLVNRGGDGLAGWAIPMATDIAFALGVLALLGSRVPLALKVFLTALAIVDDLGAVLVIAIFYTENLDASKLLLALLLWAAALVYGRLGGHKLRIFLLLGLVVWYLMLKSGVHATIAGVLMAFTIPMTTKRDPQGVKRELAHLFRNNRFEEEQVDLTQLGEMVADAQSPLHELEHGLERWVAYGIMPVFALFNAGFALSPAVAFSDPVPLGSFLGLLAGKPLGILLFCWLAVRLGFATLPKTAVDWKAIAGTAIVAGIGFTMSLFIAALAFGDGALLDGAKLGVLSASVVAAVLGLAVLHRVLPKAASPR